MPCLRQKRPGTAPKAPMQNTDTLSKPWQRLGLDFIGPLPMSTDNNRFALVAQCYFTKWPIVIPLPNMEAKTVVQALVDRIVSEHGVPETLHSDQGRSFESKIVHDVCRLLGIRKTRTTAYRPQSDGLVERFNRTLKQMVSVLCETAGENWDQLISIVLLTYRTTVHESTGFTPFFLMYGREARQPIDAVLPVEHADVNLAPGDFSLLVTQRLAEAKEFVQQYLPGVKAKQKFQHDRRVNFRQLKVGDTVLMRIMAYPKGQNAAFRPKYDGPYTIMKVYNEGLVCGIVHDSSNKRKVVHYNHLKRVPVSEIEAQLALAADEEPLDEHANDDSDAENACASDNESAADVTAGRSHNGENGLPAAEYAAEAENNNTADVAAEQSAGSDADTAATNNANITAGKEAEHESLVDAAPTQNDAATASAETALPQQHSDAEIPRQVTMIFRHR